jgi:hypothetical protein
MARYSIPGPHDSSSAQGKTQMPQSPHDRYLNDLITMKFRGQRNVLDPAVREEVKRDIARRLDSFIMSRAIPALSDNDVQRLETLLESTRSAAVAQEFVATHIPNFEDFLTDILLEFRQAYLRN